MCTAATFTTKTNDLYFGRTLDNHCSYNEEVVITPRRFTLDLRCGRTLKAHAAMIGTACVSDSYPLYYDGVNEYGLCIAGLNFVGNAVYCDAEKTDGKLGIAQFEFIPFILGQCNSLDSARRMLENIAITSTPFSASMPIAQLHWIIADKTGAITVESTKDGLHVYDNPVGVLTNNPPFPEQMFALNNYMHLSPKQPQNEFCKAIPLTLYSNGMGALGLPGDLSSQSRFVRAAYTKLNAACYKSDSDNVTQFFHILGTVRQTNGCCVMDNGHDEYTVYTSCCNAARGVYYYTTYENSRITAVDMHRVNLDGGALIRYPFIKTPDINALN